MVTGAPPFYSQDVDLMYKNISENKLMFPEIFSEELKDLLRKMLDKNPKQRIGIGNDKLIDTKDYVLGKVNSDDKKLIDDVYLECSKGLDAWFDNDFSKVMSLFNKKNNS